MTAAEAANPRIGIREATFAAVEFLRRMLFYAWRWSAQREGNRPSFDVWREENPCNPYLSDFTRRSGDGGVIAEVDGTPAGAAWYRKLTRDEGGAGYVSEEVPELVVALSRLYRGRGVGQVLMQQLLARARRDRLRSLSLHVDLDNQRARRLYQAHGFVEHHQAETGVVMINQLAHD